MFKPIVIEKNPDRLDSYIVESFANKFLNNSEKKASYYYFKIHFGRKSSRKLDEPFSKLGEKFVVFTSENVLVWIDYNKYINIWDGEKQQPEPGFPGEFLKTKDKFLNWFINVFPKLDCF